MDLSLQPLKGIPLQVELGALPSNQHYHKQEHQELQELQEYFLLLQSMHLTFHPCIPMQQDLEAHILVLLAQVVAAAALLLVVAVEVVVLLLTQEPIDILAAAVVAAAAVSQEILGLQDLVPYHHFPQYQAAQAAQEEFLS